MCIVRSVSVLYFFLICLLLNHINSAFFVQYYDNRDTWFDAQSFCHKKGGRLATNEDGLNCNQIKSPFDSSQGSTYWTGKYKTLSHWIYKIGCLEILGRPLSSTAHSVSKCFEVCRKQNIKIRLLAHIRNKCVCISEVISTLNKFVGINNCSKSIESDTHYWAYTVTKNTSLVGPGNCALIDCRLTPEVNTDKCENKRTTFCGISQCLNWTMSQEICIDHTTPGELWEICKTLPAPNLSAWLPMHRVLFWTEVTCDGIGTEEFDAVEECEAFRCYHNDRVPSFRETMSCSEKTTGYSCAFSSSNNMTTDRSRTIADSAKQCPGIFSSKSTNSHGSIKRTLNVEHITGERSFSTITNSITLPQSTTSFIEKQNDTSSYTEMSEAHATSNIGLIIGGALGALTVIGVCVLIVMLTLRRKKSLTKNPNIEQFEISDEEQQRNSLSNNIRVNELYEDERAHADRPVPLRTKEAEIAHEHGGKKPNDVYAVVMKNNKPSTLQVGLPSVVSSTDVVESEYDRLNITPTCLRDNMVNNLYDSSIGDRCESDPTYNTTTNIRHSRINTEDVYN